MKRWWIGLAVVLLACLGVWFTRAANASLLEDSDTRVLITRMEARNAPLSWFGGDWPLENHFYRPVTTLAFEMDQRLHPWSPGGYGQTNALLVCLSILALFWLLRELFDQPMLATGGACLFAAWNGLKFGIPFFGPALLGLGLLALVLSLLPGRNVFAGMACLGAACYAAFEANGLYPIRGGSMEWIPGRTATTMTVFALAAMAAYARSERLGAKPMPRPTPTATDRPATKGTAANVEPSRLAWMWATLAVLFTALALGSYEQAVMLPACLVGVAVTMRLQGYRVRWGWQVLFWGMLGLYILARKTLLPPGPSGYQLQQYRHSLDVYFTILDYLFPSSRAIFQLGNQLEFGIVAMILAQSGALAGIAANVIAYGAAIRNRFLSKGYNVDGLSVPMLSTSLLSALAFLPMAWLKSFPLYNHYHFWSMALRAGFAMAMVGLTWRLAIRAMTPRELQAPKRLVPAPGSLPHL